MQRRLSAILAADVAGYSSLMEADEAGTLARLKAHRSSVFDPAVATHGGRLVKLMGDGALVEFASVTAAVDCALAIQHALVATPSIGTGIAYRIGINLGDVIIDGDDIYGEGVNVAARLQAMAPVGGIALSATVRDHVTNKVEGSFEDLGDHAVKGLQRPVHVYLLHAAASPSQNPVMSSVPSGASVCVLPFANMSGDAEQEYFSDGITEDIITDLSKVSALWVAARNTAFTFKGKHVDVQQVARQLKVSHVLEGSVRKAGGRVRITAQLIDGASGGHVWAERYDRDLNDIFALQDEISEAIVKALKLKLLPAEKEAIERRGTTDPEAYKLYLMARQYLFTGNFGNRRRSEAIIRLCQRATEIDPGYAAAWAMMAAAQGVLRMIFAESGDGGLAAAERALALDPDLAEARAARGEVRLRNGQMAAAREDIDAALRADPESYEAHSAAASWFHAERRFAEAIPHYEKGASLIATEYTCAGMAVSCHEALGDRAGAQVAARLSLARTEPIVANEPDNGSAISFVVGALAALGEVERAKAWMERATLLDPGNHNMQYNFACTLVMAFDDLEGGLDVLERIVATASAGAINWAAKDPDLDRVRDHPRYVTAMSAARVRLGIA